MNTRFIRGAPILWLVSWSVLAVWHVPRAAAQPQQIIGVAHALDREAGKSSARPLYEEVHVSGEAGKSRNVSYRMDGIEFASKSVDYSVSAVAPDFTQQDSRRGEMIAARRDARGRVELGYRERAGTQEHWQVLEASPRPLVIDAGFDNFVRQHWQALAAGEGVDFDFAVPSRARTVHLVIASAAPAHCGGPAIAGSRCLRVYAGNYLVRMFFPALHLLYDDGGRLLRFMGLSNINDANGDGQQVRIDYRPVTVGSR
jgi:hypothetical protein